MWTCGFILHNVIINCVAKSYHSSDEKREEWASFWKCLASSISSDKSRWWSIYRLLFESSTIKMIRCTKLFTTTLKSYILFEIFWRLRRCSYTIYTTALFIKGASTKSLHHAQLILACYGSSGDGGLSEFKTAKKKIYSKNLF